MAKAIPTMVHLTERNKSILLEYSESNGVSQSSAVNLLIAKNLKNE